MKSKEIKEVPNSPWFDFEYEHLRKLRRKAEKQFRRSRLEVHRENYKNLRKQTTELAYKKKRNYYATKLKSSGSKEMYSVINQLLDNNQYVILPDSKNDEELANAFMHYFTEKIEKLRSKFNLDANPSSLVVPGNLNHTLCTFVEETTDEILQITHSFSIKCSPDDPIPANILKKNIDFFISENLSFTR